MFDADTNRDGKLDSSDIKSLYLSEISGKRFTKVSMDLQEIDWNLIDSKAAFILERSKTTKMGSLIKTMHYNYIDLSNNEWKVSNYEPI
jgi:hypothetical protein